MTNKTDHREGKKVLATIEIEDHGQDFIELDLLENGVLLGDSIMFENGRRSLLGIGTDDGMEYHTARKIIQSTIGSIDLAGLTIYLKDTGEKDPLPWEAQTLKYPVKGIKPAENINRFIKK